MPVREPKRNRPYSSTNPGLRVPSTQRRQTRQRSGRPTLAGASHRPTAEPGRPATQPGAPGCLPRRALPMPAEQELPKRRTRTCTGVAETDAQRARPPLRRRLYDAKLSGAVKALRRDHRGTAGTAGAASPGQGRPARAGSVARPINHARGEGAKNKNTPVPIGAAGALTAHFGSQPASREREARGQRLTRTGVDTCRTSTTTFHQGPTRAPPGLPTASSRGYKKISPRISLDMLLFLCGKVSGE